MKALYSHGAAQQIYTTFIFPKRSRNNALFLPFLEKIQNWEAHILISPEKFVKNYRFPGPHLWKFGFIRSVKWSRNLHLQSPSRGDFEMSPTLRSFALKGFQEHKAMMGYKPGMRISNIPVVCFLWSACQVKFLIKHFLGKDTINDELTLAWTLPCRSNKTVI